MLKLVPITKENWRIYYTPKHKVKRRLALRGVSPTGWRPDAKFFKASIDIFAIHGVIYPMNRRIFQGDGV
jgi:hypothetical protein